MGCYACGNPWAGWCAPCYDSEVEYTGSFLDRHARMRYFPEGLECRPDMGLKEAKQAGEAAREEEAK